MRAPGFLSSNKQTTHSQKVHKARNGKCHAIPQDPILVPFLPPLFSGSRPRASAWTEAGSGHGAETGGTCALPSLPSCRQALGPTLPWAMAVYTSRAMGADSAPPWARDQTAALLPFQTRYPGQPSAPSAGSPTQLGGEPQWQPRDGADDPAGPNPASSLSEHSTPQTSPSPFFFWH